MILLWTHSDFLILFLILKFEKKHCLQSLSFEEQFTDRHFVQRAVDWKSHELIIAGTSGMFLSTTEQKEETLVWFG